MIARVLWGMYSCLVLERCRGHPKIYSLWLAYPPLKPSTSLLPCALVNAFG